MKSVAVFAHYDKDNLIDDYVLYYLKELKAVCDKIIFVSDCNINDKELSKLNSLADYTIAQKHGEYDFGSYKRGFICAIKNNLLEDADNLIFANDSCYGPFYPLEQIFEKMNTKECDFWGITSNINKYRNKTIECNASNNKHIQSYFIAFKSNVFKSEIFTNFIKNIDKEKNKQIVIEKYEIGLSCTLCNAGFKYDSLKDMPLFFNGIDEIFENTQKPPFVFTKTAAFKALYFLPLFENFKNKLIQHSDYPFEIIIKHIKRIRKITKFKFTYILKQIIKLHFKEHKVFLFGKWYSI